MRRFDKVVNEKYETKSVMLHFDLEYWPDSALVPHVIPSKAGSQTFVV